MPEPTQQGKQSLWGEESQGLVVPVGSGCSHQTLKGAYLPQGPSMTQGFCSHEPQDTPGTWRSQHGQGQQGLSCGTQLGVRFQHHDEDRTELGGQTCQ